VYSHHILIIAFILYLASIGTGVSAPAVVAAAGVTTKIIFDKEN
jgi:hypothetical protein